MDDLAAAERDAQPIGLVQRRHRAEVRAECRRHRGHAALAQPADACAGERRGEVLEAVARREPPGQQAGEPGHRDTPLPRQQQQAQRDDDGVPRGQRGEAAAVPQDLRPGEKAAIGLVADHAVAGRGQHPGDHVGGADAGAHDALEPAAALHRRVAGNRRHDRVRLQPAGREDARHVAAQEFAALVAHQRTVAVAVGRADREKTVLPRPAARERLVLRPHRLGIDRDEKLRAAQPQHVGPEPREDFDQDLPGDAGVLVDRDLPSAQGTGGEKIQVAGDVGGAGLLRKRRQLGRGAQRARGVEHIGHPGRLRPDPRLVLLEDLTRRPVELDAVAVVRDVAAGDHDAGQPLAHRPARHGRSRDEPAVYRHEAAVADREGTGAHDPRRRGTQVACERHPIPDGHLAPPRQVVEKASRVGVADPVGHRVRQPPGPAGAETDAALRHQPGDGHGLHQNLEVNAATPPSGLSGLWPAPPAIGADSQ